MKAKHEAAFLRIDGANAICRKNLFYTYENNRAKVDTLGC